MPEQVSLPDGAVTRRMPVALVLAAGAAGVVLAGTIALWAHYGTAVFFEIVRSGFIACFG